MSEMRFYLAGKYSKLEGLRIIQAILHARKYVTRCRWLDGYHTTIEKRWAEEDFADIDDCTHFVLFNLPVDDPEMSAGRFIELGYAMAKHKICIVVGKGSNVFYELVDMRFATIDEFLEEFKNP